MSYIKAPASMLLLIRCPEEVWSAVHAVSEFLLRRRRLFAESEVCDELLGICARRELETDLPGWASFDAYPEPRFGVNAFQGSVSEVLEESIFGIRESLSLSGLWTLCWIDGKPLREAYEAKARRRMILDLVCGVGRLPMHSCESEVFFPVFAAGETLDAVHDALHEIRRHHPGILGGVWFIDNRAKGIVPGGETEGRKIWKRRTLP